jgi:outer membrane protein assembly factor BamB
MSKRLLSVGLVALVASVFANGSYGEEAKFELPAMGGFAVSPDGSMLVVALTAKAELVYFDTEAGKEAKRVTVEFQPSQMAWGDKVLFAAQKGSGVVHVLDTDSGKEVAKGNADSPVRNLAVVKGTCFASTVNRGVYAFDAKGTATKTDAQGTFIAADPMGAFLCTVIDGRATTDVTKYRVSGTKLARGETFRSLRASLINVQGVQISADGKAFGVVAGGGWADTERKRHYSVPLYSTDDMKSQLGELETGPYPSGFAVNLDLPVLFACTGTGGSLFNARSFVPVEKFAAPQEVAGAATPSVLAFVAKGRKLAWGTSRGDVGVLKFYDVKSPSK